MTDKHPMLYNYMAYITPDMVIDGDTLKNIQIDLGFSIHVTVKLRIRLVGMDAPEIRTKDLEEKAKGFESKKYLEELIAQGEEFFISVYGVDKYGRWLADLWIDNINATESMVYAGKARWDWIY